MLMKKPHTTFVSRKCTNLPALSANECTVIVCQRPRDGAATACKRSSGLVTAARRAPPHCLCFVTTANKRAHNFHNNDGLNKNANKRNYEMRFEL